MSVLLIEQHFKDHRQKLVKRLTRRAGTEWAAEDILQEAYYRALKYVDSFNPLLDMDKWMNTIINNSLREYKNQEKGYSPVEFDEEETEGQASVEFPQHVMWQVYDIIATKSEEQQEILQLYFRQEYSAKDISEITPHKYKMVHQTIQRFRNELKELYG